MKTYRAMEAYAPGLLRLVERPVVEPGPRQVRLRVEAAGVCHSDVATIMGTMPGFAFPRVPGHEIAGRIEAIGSQVDRWKVGDRVGLGWFGGECGKCISCRKGDFITCTDMIATGLSTDGGYAELVIAEARALAAIPNDLPSEEVAPLMCAGVTTFNGIRNAGIRSGARVAVQGLGGLGHLAIQFARKMGFYTIAIGRGQDKEELATRLGAHEYVNASEVDPARALQEYGGMEAIIATAPSGASMGPLMAGLTPRGKLVVLGLNSEPITINAFQLCFPNRSVVGSLTGTAQDEEETLRFSKLQEIRPMIEIMPLECAAEAFEKMMRGDARFRIVLRPGV